MLHWLYKMGLNTGHSASLLASQLYVPRGAQAPRYLLWFDDVFSTCSIVLVAAAVILGVPLTAPFTGHTRYAPGNTTYFTHTHACVCEIQLCVCVCCRSYGEFGFFLTVAAQL